MVAQGENLRFLQSSDTDLSVNFKERQCSIEVIQHKLDSILFAQERKVMIPKGIVIWEEFREGKRYDKNVFNS